MKDLQLLHQNLKLFFGSSIMKNSVEPSSLARFPVNLICCIAFGSASSFCCLLKSIATNLEYFLK